MSLATNEWKLPWLTEGELAKKFLYRAQDIEITIKIGLGVFG